MNEGWNFFAYSQSNSDAFTIQNTRLRDGVVDEDDRIDWSRELANPDATFFQAIEVCAQLKGFVSAAVSRK